MPAIPRVDRIKVVYSAAKKLNFGFRMTGFPDAPFNNGVANYQPQLQRLTFRFCKQNETCVGMRNFIEYSLVKFGTENPTCSIYVIPAKNTIPTLQAEYSNGRMVHLNAKNMTLEQVHVHVNNLRTRSGQPIVHYEAAQTAKCKSIQGMWSSVYWQDSRQNLGELPRPELDTFRNTRPSLQELVANSPIKNDSQEEEKEKDVRENNEKISAHGSS